MCKASGPEWYKGWSRAVLVLCLDLLGLIILILCAHSSPGASRDATNGSHLQHFWRLALSKLEQHHQTVSRSYAPRIPVTVNSDCLMPDMEVQKPHILVAMCKDCGVLDALELLDISG